jgi:hypothetical protein
MKPRAMRRLTALSVCSLASEGPGAS